MKALHCIHGWGQLDLIFETITHFLFVLDYTKYLIGDLAPKNLVNQSINQIIIIKGRVIRAAKSTFKKVLYDLLI